MSKFYVTMTDGFMSGWGKAQGKTNVFAVECNSLDQARIIEAAAEQRPEMKNVKITHTEPRSTKTRLVSLELFENLGSVWTGSEAL